MLQKLPKCAVKTLLHFYNRVWLKREFPAAWRHSIVLPVLKQGKDPQLVSSYRPISLTSTLCKILERLVTTRLTYHVEKNNLLSNVQSGFRQGRCTVDQIMRLQDAINKHNHTKGFTVGVFIDFQSAFDMVWQKGLLIKMKNMGITGNVFSFVENFLSDRTLQVRVGAALSDTQLLDNGTAQGSVISPLLFLLMINDLPDSLHGVETSLFADDSCIYKSGKNLDKILEVIQHNLDLLADWCERCGFRINTDKTVVVLFTHRIDKIEKILKINDKPLRVVKTVKFLGLIFDTKLTWNAHINYIEEKCKKRLNILRMISGQSWGAGKATLLTVYRALIRSVLDYGSIAYNSTSLTNKLKLDRIQSKALRIICGAFCSTSIAAMQVECGEMPLEIRRTQQELNFAIKLKATARHPAKSILERNRLSLSHKFTENSKPLYQKVKDFLDITNVDEMEAPRVSDIAPWRLKIAAIDTALSNEVSKKESPEVLKALALERIDMYKCTVNIYTDASRDTDNKTSAAFYIPSLQVQYKARLSDHLTIFAAELTAIKLALAWVLDHNNVNAVTIFSDSLSAIKAIESGRTTSRPNLLNQVLELLTGVDSTVVLVWIPSHIGLTGNEIADRLAGSAIANAQVDVHIPLEMGEAYLLVEQYVVEQWQRSWATCSNGRQYRQIEPDVGRKVKYTCNTRRKEVTATRLRLGKCSLNAYLYEIHAHPDGLCELCRKPETIHHFLLDCNNVVCTALLDACRKLKVVPSLKAVLSDERLLTVMYSNLDRRL